MRRFNQSEGVHKTIKLDFELTQELEAYAERRGLSFSRVVEDIIYENWTSNFQKADFFIKEIHHILIELEKLGWVFELRPIKIPQKKETYELDSMDKSILGKSETQEKEP